MSSPPPQPDPVNPSDLPEVAAAVIREAKFPMLASIDVDGQQPRLRPVSPVRVDGFTIYVANLRSYHKTAELVANDRVELCYLAPNHDQLRITGRAEALGESEGDADLIAEIWEGNPLLRRYLGTPENPELIIYRIRPDRVRFMREWALEYHEVPIAGDNASDSDGQGSA